MRWVKEFNNKCNQSKQDFYELSLDRLEKVSVLYEEVYKTVVEISNLRMYDSNSSKETLKKVEKTADLLNLKIESLFELIKIVITKSIEDMGKYHSDFLEELDACTKIYVRTRKDAMLITSRFRLWDKQARDNMKEIYEYMIYGMSSSLTDRLTKEGLDEIEVLVDRIPIQPKEIEELEKIPLKNIYSWKEMEDLALSNNFVYKSANGSHRIYENKKTNKIVVIPAHELGKGLSCKIQKQIFSGVM